MNLEKEVLNNGSAVKVAERVEIKVKGGKAYAFFKRAFDIFSSALALIVLFPFLLIISILVKVTSKGPVFFKDNRIGLNGKDIVVYKFRTMYEDAEERIKSYLTEEQYQIWLIDRKIDKDPRITKIGNFLRKTSIDELPQLINIFIGNMSVVGSRPITKYELETKFTEDEAKYFIQAKPGLTGYWQVNGRSNISFENGERQKMELEYLTKRGFWFDIGLIFKTIPAVIKGRGAK